MEVFDKDGKLIEGVFSKEEVDAQIKAASEKAVADAKVVADAAAEAARVAAEEAAAGGEQVPEWAKTLQQRVDSLTNHNTQSYLGKVVTGLDADKAKEVEAKYSSLSGYGETPEDLARRSEDAYLLATGQKYNAGTVNMNNIMASGGGRIQGEGKVTTEVDKSINDALGNSAADIAKFGKK